MKEKGCPFCYLIPMGMSPEGWNALEEVHNRKHLPQCPTCEQPIKSTS